jgi:hypothetical protein
MKRIYVLVIFLVVSSFSAGLCIGVVSNYTTKINANSTYLTVEAWNDAKWTRSSDNKTWMFLYEPAFNTKQLSNLTYPHFPWFSTPPGFCDKFKGYPVLVTVSANVTDFFTEGIGWNGMFLNATSGASYLWEDWDGTPVLMIDILVANPSCVLLEFKNPIT